ncbi:carbamoyltransferase family protein [Methylohalobius crimeensis]|uniref:carbamoyltransferase family protein n=1 Tax=Methylohalobius crimeensis TaxID=244365 RepID=UPI0003B7B486|nr:carbamoyltransferase C-terminal domain-containing protein [Methylohalobius crimeensis]
MSQRIYIGLSTTYHDPAIAVVDETGRVLFAEAAERCLQYKRGLNVPPDPLPHVTDWLERYCDHADTWVIASNWSRKRPWYEYASRWLGYFLPQGLVANGYRDHSTFLEKYKLFHMLACQNASVPLGGINLVRQASELFPAVELRFHHFDHHDCHAAAACFSSPFSEGSCLIVDSYGERGSLAAYHYRDGAFQPLRVGRGIASLGFFYMWLTELCGFDWLAGEEWKVMGLAAYGQIDDTLRRRFRKMLWTESLDLRQNLAAILADDAEIEALRRRPGRSPLEAADLARTGQEHFTEIVCQLATNLYPLAPSSRLILGGGCALNSACNGRLLAETPFEHLHVPYAPADDGTALGAALLAWRRDHPGQRPPPASSPYLGSSLDPVWIERLVRHSGLRMYHLPKRLEETVADYLAQGLLVGWVQGRAEFGPRALGNRSVLADPRDPGMKNRLNTRIKFREEFRPFAPAILDEYGAEYFQPYQTSPYMERALPFKPKAAAQVPAVVHADGTGRVQSVIREWNPRFHRLLTAFHRLTGVPLLLNTSFNLMGKPILHNVEDAVATFMTCGLDILVIEDYLFLKPHVESL